MADPIDPYTPGLEADFSQDVSGGSPIPINYLQGGYGSPYSAGPSISPGQAEVAGAGSLVNAGIGIYQAIKASSIKPVRPVYQRPDEIKAYIARKQAAYGGARYPRQQDEAMLDQLTSQSITQGKNVVNDPYSVAALAGGASAQRMKSQREVQRMGAQDKIRRLHELDQANQIGAEYSNKEFDVNKMQPYLNAAAAKSALQGAAMKNISSGISGAAGAAAMLI